MLQPSAQQPGRQAASHQQLAPQATLEHPQAGQQRTLQDLEPGELAYWPGEQGSQLSEACSLEKKPTEHRVYE